MSQTEPLKIASESHGPADAPTILLVHGLGVPLSGWPPALIDSFLANGFRVVLFDNRDIGQSDLLTHLPNRSVAFEFLRSRFGLKIRAPYLLSHMMQDAISVLDELNIESAHVVGVSMGGMISQLMAIHAPKRVSSLTSIMSTTGRRSLPGPTRQIRNHLINRPRNATPDEQMEYGVRTWELIGSPAYKKSRAETEAFLSRLYARGITGDGVTRQTLAIMASPDRFAALGGISTPSLVLHGDQDPLVPLACGEDTAKAIKNAKMHVYRGMGHDLPDELIGDIAKKIIEHAERAESSGKGSRAA